MINSAQSLKDKVKKLANSKKVTVQDVMQNYMFERFLARLSVSKYKNNFFLKGGLLLSDIMGIEYRTTIDIDTCIKGLVLNESNMRNILEEIVNIDLEDNISFEFLDLYPIRDEDIYGRI
jgi:transcriptional regulator of aromatic amino acid metabolism